MSESKSFQPIAEFKSFLSIARYSREVVVTEKIDGTNAQILIRDDGEIFVGSRTRWIMPTNDNHGFAAWVYEHRDEILKLGPGRHYGEWWGYKIQRGYNKQDRSFSLFNVDRWHLAGDEPHLRYSADPRIKNYSDELPTCCSLVPILWRGNFDDFNPKFVLDELIVHGSAASPGYMNPEGIVIHHLASRAFFKKMIHKDDLPKSVAAKL